MSKNSKRLTIIFLFFIVFSIGLGIVTRAFTEEKNEEITIVATQNLSTSEKNTVSSRTGSEESRKKSENSEKKEDTTMTKSSTDTKTSQTTTSNKTETKTKTTATETKSSTTTKSVTKSTTEDTKNEKDSNTAKPKATTQIASTYKGYSTAGKIEIPKTGANLYILKKQTVSSMKVGVCLLYSTGELNKSGQTLILGHNSRDGKLFSNNNKLKVGDSIYITTLDGKKVKYVIYRKFISKPEDASYINRSGTEKPEIVLSSCTDDEENRIVIMARAN